MNHKRLLLAVFAVWLHWSAAFAQTISVPDPYVMGNPLVVTISDLPEGSRLLWENGPGVSLEAINQNTFHGWVPRAGKYPLKVFAAPPDGPLVKATKTLNAVDSGPVNPEPEDKTLAQLAGDKAPALSEMYAELLAALGGNLFDDVAHFRRTEVAGLKQRTLTGHGATAAIAKRLAVATLDELKAAVAKVVEELGAPGPTVPPGPLTTATAAAYIYEKDDGGVPSAVSAALSELNTDIFRATTFEEDTTDSSGDVPDQYKVPLPAARTAGLPALVVTAGEKVRRVVKAPTTREQVLEAVK